jgi:hypothetical protein
MEAVRTAGKPAKPYSERGYLIEHRADRELPAHTVRVEPPVIRAFLEMKMREAPPL